MTQELARPAATPSDVTRDTNNLYELWGDTVDSRHLVLAILISAVVSLGTYALASHLLPQSGRQKARTKKQTAGGFTNGVIEFFSI